MNILKIGKRVKHNFTKFEGKIAAYAVYENGDVTYGIRPDQEDKTKVADLIWLGIKDVTLIKTK